MPTRKSWLSRSHAPCKKTVLRDRCLCLNVSDAKGQRSELTPNLIYLGNYGSVDTYENSWTAEYENSLVGISRDHTQLNIVQASASDGGDGVVNDDDYGTYDYVQYYIDGEYNCTKTDTTMSANVTLTLTDGSTRVVEVVMMQQQNGDLFISDLLNCGTLDNLSIANVRIDAITGDNYSGWYTNQSVDNT